MSDEETKNGTPQQRERLIRYPELEQRFGRCKKSIQRHSAVGKLPRLVRDGKIVGMLASEVEAYFQRLREQPAR
jgi:predicted DNA-binding transcriptional regulator AlpA